MNLVCCGLSHRTAQVEVRERFAFGDRELPLAVRELTAIDGVREALILSTCNRVEHYAVLDDDLAADPARTERLAEAFFWRRLEADGHAIEPEQFFHLDGARGVEHLFRVACGLESMVLGETEILGQVKQAYLVALGAGTTGRMLNKLFQRAFQVAKQVRSKTQIGRGSVSVASAAADLAEKLFGDLGGCRALILGAGDTGATAARSLLSRGLNPGRSLIANRTPERAAALAAELGWNTAPFARWDAEARDIDILVAATSAPGLIVTKRQLAAFMRDRADRPLFVIDLAVPRDVEPGANDLEGVYLYDVDSLRGIAEQAMASRRAEVAECERIIGGHVDEFAAWQARETARLAAAGAWTQPAAVTPAVQRG